MDGGGDGEYGEHGEWELQDESRTVHAAHEPTSGRRQSISDDHQSTSDGRYTRVISREQSEESVEFRCQRVLYQAFVSEMMEIVAPLGSPPACRCEKMDVGCWMGVDGSWILA